MQTFRVKKDQTPCSLKVSEDTVSLYFILTGSSIPETTLRTQVLSRNYSRVQSNHNKGGKKGMLTKKKKKVFNTDILDLKQIYIPFCLYLPQTL